MPQDISPSEHNVHTAAEVPFPSTQPPILLSHDSLISKEFSSFNNTSTNTFTTSTPFSNENPHLSNTNNYHTQTPVEFTSYPPYHSTTHSLDNIPSPYTNGMTKHASYDDITSLSNSMNKHYSTSSSTSDSSDNPSTSTSPVLSSSAPTLSSSRPLFKSSSSKSITPVASTSSSPSSAPSLRTSRNLTKKTSSKKIILFHPSIAAPSNARRLDGTKNVLVMYNPKSGNKKGEKVMEKTVDKLKRQGLEVQTLQLEYAEHATEICKNRPNFDDIDMLCVIGGDGTFHEVVNGLMQNPLNPSLPALSVIPAGTGNSMVRELQGISSVRVSTDEVLSGITVPIDILKVTILSSTNVAPSTEHKFLAGSNFVPKEVIYAFNSVHWGLASRILERAEKMRWMGHGIRYTAASMMELLGGKSTHARVIFEDANGKVTEYDNDTFCLLIANNIGTAGKGMKMAPKAKINDGLIDLLLIRSHKPWHLMKIFEKVYSGTHVDLPYVEYVQVRKFCIIPYHYADPKNQSNPEFAEEVVDIDGELKGFTPFEVEVIPQALELIV